MPSPWGELTARRVFKFVKEHGLERRERWDMEVRGKRQLEHRTRIQPDLNQHGQNQNDHRVSVSRCTRRFQVKCASPPGHGSLQTVSMARRALSAHPPCMRLCTQ